MLVSLGVLHCRKLLSCNQQIPYGPMNLSHLILSYLQPVFLLQTLVDIFEENSGFPSNKSMDNFNFNALVQNISYMSDIIFIEVRRWECIFAMAIFLFQSSSV